MKKKVDDLKNAEEPVVTYGIVNETLMASMMGNQHSSPSDFDLIALARKGIPKKALTALGKQISLTMEEIASILHISDRTLQRYTQDTLVKTEYADRAIALAKLYERGIEVLGTTKAFNSWIRHPNKALNNETPLDLLDTGIGFEMVLQVLGRIEYGVFS